MRFRTIIVYMDLLGSAQLSQLSAQRMLYMETSTANVHSEGTDSNILDDWRCVSVGKKERGTDACNRSRGAMMHAAYNVSDDFRLHFLGASNEEWQSPLQQQPGRSTRSVSLHSTVILCILVRSVEAYILLQLSNTALSRLMMRIK